MQRACVNKYLKQSKQKAEVQTQIINELQGNIQEKENVRSNFGRDDTKSKEIDKLMNEVDKLEKDEMLN